MKTKILATLAVAAALSLANAGLAQEDPGAPGRPPGPPHAPLGKILKDLIQKYDANADQALDQAELAALVADVDAGKVGVPHRPGGPGGPRGHLPPELLEKYDADQDGLLNETERAALQQDIKDGKVPPPMRHDREGFGPGPRHLPKEILDRFDADKDGVLNETERAALDAAVQSGEVKPPMRRGRPPGPRPQ